MYLLRYRLEVSTGPKFPARPAKKFFGPARNQCIRKFVLYNVFEILHQNRYNYIKLHSHFPLVQILYCPSTTVMYNVQSCTSSDSRILVRGAEHWTKFHTWTPLMSCTAMASPKFRFGGTFSKMYSSKTFEKILKVYKTFAQKF